MAVRVTRDESSDGDATDFLRLVDEMAVEEIARLSRSPEMFGMALSSMLSRAAAHCLNDAAADRSVTWEAWTAAMQVGSALFEAATTSEGQVECLIAHEVRRIPAVAPSHFTDAGNWLTALWLAVICREQGRVAELARVPVDLLRESGAVYDEYIYSWVGALQSYFTEGPELGERLVAAFRGTSPEEIRVAPRELLLKVLYPPLNLFLRFIQRDQEQFNAALVEGLQLHKEYWTGSEERRESTDGAVPLGLLAIACLAYDVGMRVEVDSEYLPKHLLERSWLGEFPT
ncbi:immunity 49 family protein [Streptomyces candidus]|uniref:Immunity 49 family protein n=1 Tax=Streptomyces candidus TaxID=67283 RepID=A0A7X0LMX5_9ACTN|nr:immunity 49 family protein [Streptomyces candidus]MBB6434277.1 hypothetical protein [Streptomyces candidus]GHH37277.1 hypothetical protein GCM10018773_13800 [Streptomyces candidus]